MKIINAHTHVIEISKVLAEDNLHYLEYLKGIPAFTDLEDVTRMLSLENLLFQMDEAGIQKSVLFAVDGPLLTSENEFVANICQQHPERFIGFASVDPNRKNAREILQNALDILHLKGLKLHPPIQNFYPNDKKIWPLYQIASNRGIPVVFHVGTTPFGNMVKLSQANPLLIDDVANDFPDLKIILTHLGTLWHNESFMVTEKHPNVYIDTAAYPYEIEELLKEKLIIRVGPEKFIFGTDFPMPYEGKMHRLKDFVDIFEKINLSAELKEKILALNFEELMDDLI
ncbi:MAG: amidohydrolase [Bacteroidales bacterium]|nr:amidohydrolase [Bacteroidales bacterium]